MRIGIAGPIDITLLRDLLPARSELPSTYRFALTASLARALHERGHEIVLFALSSDVTSTRHIDGGLMRAYICQQRRPRWQMLDAFRGERHSLRDAMRASGCDVVHAHWTYEFASAAIDSGLPCVVTAHDLPTVVLRFARHPYWLEKPLLAWHVLRNAKSLTAVSPYVADGLRRFVRRDQEITVIPNGATSDVFALYRERESQASRMPFRFASVLNGWSARKNGSRLIQAFAMVRREFGPNVELSMFGDGYGPGGPADQWSRARSLEEGIQFAGPQPYGSLMPRLAQTADVLVHPSREEAHCMAVTEAMAMGIPVIGGNNSGGIPWALDYGDAGLLVDVALATSIASGMRALLNDVSLRGSLGRSGHQKALNEYKLETAAARYESVLMKAHQEQVN